MRQFLLSLKFLILFGLTAIIVSVYIGLKTDNSGFWSNVSAEIIGVVLGILITYLIIENYIKSQKKKERENILKFTIFSISLETIFIINKYCVIIPSTGSQPLLSSMATDVSFRDGLVSDNTVKLLDEYQKLLKNSTSSLQSTLEKKHISNFFEAIEPNINNITDVLIPRLFLISEDFISNEIFIVSEKILVNARNDYPLFKQDLISKEKMFETSISLLGASKSILNAVSKMNKTSILDRS